LLSFDCLLQTAQLHVDEGEAGLEVACVLRERRLFDAELDGVAVLRGMIRNAVERFDAMGTWRTGGLAAAKSMSRAW
jgi:hypothetical protein